MTLLLESIRHWKLSHFFIAGDSTLNQVLAPPSESCWYKGNRAEYATFAWFLVNVFGVVHDRCMMISARMQHIQIQTIDLHVNLYRASTLVSIYLIKTQHLVWQDIGGSLVGSQKWWCCESQGTKVPPHHCLWKRLHPAHTVPICNINSPPCERCCYILAPTHGKGRAFSRITWQRLAEDRATLSVISHQARCEVRAVDKDTEDRQLGGQVSRRIWPTCYSLME